MKLFKTLKNKIGRNKFILFFKLFPELIDELLQLTNSLGASNTLSNKSKMEGLISISYHAIEKGLSLPEPRVGFGEGRIINTIELLNQYINKYGVTEFIYRPIVAIKQYFNFNHFHNYYNEKIERSFNLLINKFNIDISNKDFGGIIKYSKEENKKEIPAKFLNFVKSRHSIRNFNSFPVSKNSILKAIEIAQYTPSSCNRQPWKVYVFLNEEMRKKILNFQGGNKGFTNTINVALLITSNLNNYYINEIHQAYIDGGLYAMSLIYAFHSQNLGIIPLTTSFKRNKINELQKMFNISRNEIPIMLLGVGHLKDEFFVTCSKRNEVGDNTIIVN